MLTHGVRPRLEKLLGGQKRLQVVRQKLLDVLSSLPDQGARLDEQCDRGGWQTKGKRKKVLEDYTKNIPEMGLCLW